MRGYGAAVVHLSPHAFGEAEVGRRQRRRDRQHGRRARAARPSADRVPARADVAVRRAGRARLGDGYRRGLAEAGIAVRRAPGREHGVQPRRRRASAIDGLLAGDAPFTAVCCGQRPARARGAAAPGASSGSTSRARSRSPASTTSRRRRSRRRGSRPSGCRSTRSAAAASSSPSDSSRAPAATRGPADRAGDARVDGPATAPWRCPGRGRPARDGGGRLMGGLLAGRVVLVTGSSRGIGAEVAVKAAAEGATVAVHYHRSADGGRADVSRGARAPAPRATRFAADIARRRQAEALVEARHRAVRARRRPRQQRRADARRAVPRDRAGRLGRGHPAPT